MSWSYHYDGDDDVTHIYHNDNKIGSVGGEITSWQSGMPTGEAKQLIKESVDDPMVVDLLYGFSKHDE